MNKKYIALTIGPITKTLDKAQSTKALWGASYLLSYLMKNIVRFLFEKKRNFVFPIIDQEQAIFKPQSGAGLFPDRLIFETQPNDISSISYAIDYSLDSLCTEEVCKAINTQIRFMRWRKALPPNFTYNPVTKEVLKEYMLKYLTLYAIEDEFSKNTNIVEEFNKPLSILELQNPILAEEPIDYLSLLLENIHDTHLPNDAFGTSVRFPSIIEITTQEFSIQNPDVYKSLVKKSLDFAKTQFNKSQKEDNIGDQKFITEEDTLIADLKSHFKDEFKRRHKYIAIVKADGDNMGKTFEKLYALGEDAVREANQILLKFNVKSIEIINKHGGKPIFLGGDDLLFFSPLEYNSTNVFELISLISDEFDSHFKKIQQQYGVLELPTLSFGVSLSYYKFPMFEALKIAEEELHKAKPQDKSLLKNNVSFRLQKHSGQSFGDVFSKIPTKENENQNPKSVYSEFCKMIANAKVDKPFLASVQYVLLQNEGLLSVVIEDDEKLENFFTNFFNEEIHKQNRWFLDSIRDFMVYVFRQTKDTQKTRNLVYCTLRMIQFINQPENQDENDL